MPRLIPAARLVLAEGRRRSPRWPRDRTGWARLCRLISLGRLRARKGTLRSAPARPAWRAPRGWSCSCTARAPGDGQRGAGEWRTAERLTRRFGGQMHLAPGAALRRPGPARASTGSPQLAARARTAHGRHRPPAHASRPPPPSRGCADGVRHGCRVDELGRAALANGEQRLRSEAEMRRLLGPHAEARRPRRRRWPRAAPSISAACATNIPARSPKAKPPQQRLSRLAREGLNWRYPARRARAGAHAARPRARADRQAELRALFPDRARHRRLCPRARHPLPGARLGGEFGGLLLPRRHLASRPRSAPWSSSASCPRRATSRPTSTSISSTSAARR